jgi:hypothetical protein
MSDERKPHWPWIVALLIALPVVYVASVGPVYWIASRIPATNTPEGGRVLSQFYSPIWAIPIDTPVRRPLEKYVMMGTRTDSFLE